MKETIYKSYNLKLLNLKADQQFRSIRPVEEKSGRYIFLNGQTYLNLSSNNYLGLDDQHSLNREFLDFLNDSGMSSFDFGSTSSRLLTGNHPVFNKLESLIESLYQKERCLIFNSGYHANIGILSALMNKGDIIFSDKLNHASIIDGMRLSEATFQRYPHLDYERLEKLLEQKRDSFNNALIVTESVFSMDGDVADLKKLANLAKKYNALLMVDEAHAFAVYGANGCGICEAQNVIDEVDIILGTFGKAAGGIGAFAVCNQVIHDYLVNFARSLIFSTALPSVNIYWVYWLLSKKEELLAEQRLALQDLTNRFRSEVKRLQLNTLGSTQIVPIILGNNEKTVEVAEYLQNQHFWVLPIRPPTVPAGTSRLRLSLTANLHWDEIMNIPTLISEVI